MKITKVTVYGKELPEELNNVITDVTNYLGNSTPYSRELRLPYHISRLFVGYCHYKRGNELFTKFFTSYSELFNFHERPLTIETYLFNVSQTRIK